MQRVTTIDDETLAELRRHVKSLCDGNGSGLQAREIIDFCERMRTLHGITIDLRAVQELGEALVIVHPAAPARPLSGLETLSPREHEVALLLCAGLRNREIADRLQISVATVKDHVHHVLEKTGMPNRSAFVACYLTPR